MSDSPNPYDAPTPGHSDQEPLAAVPVGPDELAGDATGGVIPYKNVPALVGYYLAVFSLIPCLALILGPAAIICGILGVRRYKARRQVSGITHAIVALVLGRLTFLGNLITIVLMIVGANT